MKLMLYGFVMFISLTLLGCNTENEFNKEEFFLEATRQLDKEHFEIAKSLPHQIDRIRLKKLAETFQMNIDNHKIDHSIINQYEAEVTKSLKNNHFKLYNTQNLLRKLSSLHAKTGQLEKTIIDDATEIQNAMKKQYQTEIQLITYNVEADKYMLKYLESKRKNVEFKLPFDAHPPVSPDSEKILQSIVDHTIKKYDNELDSLKKNK